jgi:hypothetical protein
MTFKYLNPKHLLQLKTLQYMRHSKDLIFLFCMNNTSNTAGIFHLSVKKMYCAARAFCDCPAIISHRPRSQNILKEAQLNPGKDSRIKRARSHVSLEKSSQNYKPLGKWAKPNLTPDVTPHPSQCLGECIWQVCHMGKA